MMAPKFFIRVFFSLLTLLQVAPVFAQDPIVYSRCVRTTENIELTTAITVDGQVQQASRVMKGIDIYDVLPDVTNFFGDFSAPCDLIYRDENGSEKVLYDCSTISTDDNACAALDPAVSFDGKTIAFSVFRGTLENKTINVDDFIFNENADPSRSNHILPNKKLKSTGAHLYTVDVATNVKKFKPFEDGIYDSGPAFLANDRLAFTSNRDKNTTTVVWRSTGSGVGTRIWSIDLNWNNLDLDSHHSLSQEQHPYLLKNGRLAYSSWQVLGALPFRHTNGGVGGFTTTRNLFHIYSQFPDGAENFAIFGQHSGDHFPSYFGTNHNAAHFITQTTDERIWWSDYYRGNNNGLGVVTGVMAEPDGQEGKAPEDVILHSDIFVPRDVIDFAPWGTNADQPSRALTAPSIKHPNYDDNLVFAGKVGHPAALPNNGLMVAWGKGACTSVANTQIFGALGLPIPANASGSSNAAAMNMMTHLNLDVPGCDIGVYKATTIPSLHPSDLEMIVDSPDWHEIMARAVIPYNQIHDVNAPKDIPNSADKIAHPLLEKGTPFGLLGAASITDRETHPQKGITFAGEYQFNLQGTDTINYNDEDLCGVRILGMMPNRDENTFYGLSNLFGERVRILGEFSVLNKESGAGDDPSGNPDTSFLVRMPANTPYLMQSIDCQGRTLNTDMTWQSLRPGEQKVCGGCHVHSKPSRITFEESFAATNDYTVPRLGEGIIPLLNGKAIIDGNETVVIKKIGDTDNKVYAMSIDFERDIMPIFQARCTSCHSGETPSANLNLDILGDNKRGNVPDATWWCLVGDYSQQCLPEADRFDTGEGTKFRRPQVSKYVRAFNSLGSLLYWKAANERTDRNTDDSYNDDLDFGTNHPTDITEDELGLLSRWIDIGVPGGDKELIDTQKPTIHMVPASAEESVTTVKIGTVDAGSGINASSLIVCVLDGEVCTNLAAQDANMSGVIIVPLNQTLTDPTAEILASVEDVTGNITEIRRTVGYLTNGNNSNIIITPIADVIIDEDNPYNFTVSVTDGNNVPNTITVVASEGVVELISGTEYKLTPPENFTGDIFVMVIVVDNNNSSDADSSSFTVSVIPVNDAPTSVSGTISTSVNTPSIRSNIEVVDPDNNDTHTLIVKKSPLHGTVSAIEGTSLIYTPINGYFGSDTFEVTVTDSGGLSVDGEISVVINATAGNSAPTSANASIVTTLNTTSASVDVDIVDPDSDDTHTLVLKTAPLHGLVDINGISVIYVPDTGYSGTDSFAVTVTDNGGLSVDGMVNVTINQTATDTNRAPTSVRASIVTTRNTASPKVNVIVVDPDTEDTHTLTIKTAPLHGSVNIKNTSLVFTPETGYSGTDTFVLTATDAEGLSVDGTINVIVNLDNSPPISASAVIVTTMNNKSAAVSVNIVDPDLNDTHAVVIKNAPVHGTLVIKGTALIYTPESGFSGTDDFEITVSDRTGLTVDGLVSVVVNQTNSAPTSATASISTTINTESDSVKVNIVDADLVDTYTLTIITGPTNGNVIIDNINVIYVPNTDFVGDNNFEIRVTDSGGLSVDGIISVTVTDDTDTGGGDTGGGDTGGGDTGGDNIAPTEDSGGGSVNLFLLLTLLSFCCVRYYRRSI